MTTDKDRSPQNGDDLRRCETCHYFDRPDAKPEAGSNTESERGAIMRIMDVPKHLFREWPDGLELPKTKWRYLVTQISHYYSVDIWVDLWKRFGIGIWALAASACFSTPAQVCIFIKEDDERLLVNQ